MIHPGWLYLSAVGVLLAGAALALGATLLQLRQRAEGFRRYGDRLIVQRETLQARVAGELHDDACQRIAFLCMDLDRLADAAPAAADRASLLGIRAELADLGAALRTLAHSLHPVHLAVHTLPELLEELADTARREGALEVEVAVRPGPAGLTQAQAVCTYRVAQEAIHNALKHARATRLALRLTTDEDAACLEIADDGVGFHPQQPRHGTSLGLTTMRERAGMAGGTLTLATHPGGGTRIELRFPLLDGPWPAS